MRFSRSFHFGNPEKALARISPNGETIAFLAPVNGILNIWTCSRREPDKAKSITTSSHRDILHFSWAYTNNHLLYLSDSDGDENWRIHCVDLRDLSEKTLTNMEGIHAKIIGLGQERPHWILAGINDRNPSFHDLYHIHIETGEKRLALKNDQFHSFWADRALRPKISAFTDADGTLQIFYQTEDCRWNSIKTVAPDDVLTFQILGMDQEAKFLYLLDGTSHNTAALTRFNLETKMNQVLAQDSKSDAIGVVSHPATGKAQAAKFHYLHPFYRFLDSEIKADFQYLDSISSGSVSINSRSLDDQIWIVEYERENGPKKYFIYERVQHKAKFLFSNIASVETTGPTKMHPVEIKTRDNLTMASYLTLPPQFDRHSEGRPETPLPLVLLVHGGPWARVFWGYNARHQWLADRGYAALSVNYRGSSGFGKEFLNAGNHQWGKKMNDDLLDAVDWAISNGVADPDRIGLMGQSYGGYATLMAMSLFPNRFACGVDIVGPSDLMSFLNSIPEYWKPELSLFTKRIGDPTTPQGQKELKRVSPVSHLHQLKKPLLVGQGARDPRVKKEESDRIVETLSRKKVPIVYAVFPDEGHHFVNAKNRIAFYAAAEAFFATWLGGECEPIEKAISESSMEIPVGQDLLFESKYW